MPARACNTTTDLIRLLVLIGIRILKVIYPAHGSGYVPGDGFVQSDRGVHR